MDDGQPGKPGRVTIKTVAADAGVSVAAVSKVLRDAYGVSESLRERVNASIARLGYRPSAAARGMRGRTHTVGILLVEMGNPFLPALIDAISTALAVDKVKTMLAVGDASPQLETSLIESMLDFRMDGLILIAPRVSRSFLEGFAARAPMVVIGHHETGETGFDTVNSDDRAGGRMVTEALIAAGHRRIAMMTVDRAAVDADVFRQREYGYRDALDAAGRLAEAQVLRVRNARSDQSDPADFHPALDQLTLPAALFCWSDIAATGILNAAAERGIRVPEDLAVIGYDNNPIARMPLVGLSSVEQDPRALGRLAAECLSSRIAGRTEARHLLVRPRLVHRRSGGATQPDEDG